MPQAVSYAFAYHQLLVTIAGSVCLFGTWVGMRHFARARATAGTTRIGWLFMASVGTGAALWASTFISILALDPSLNSGFEPIATGAVLLVAIVACLAGLRDRQPPLHAGARGRRPRDGRRHPRHARHRLPGLAHRRPRRMERLGLAMTFLLGLTVGARGQPRQPAGDPLVPPWRRDRAGFHDLRHALRADGLDRHDCGSVRCAAGLSHPGACSRPGRGRRGVAGHGLGLLDLHHRPEDRARNRPTASISSRSTTP